MKEERHSQHFETPTPALTLPSAHPENLKPHGSTRTTTKQRSVDLMFVTKGYTTSADNGLDQPPEDVIGARPYREPEGTNLVRLLG